MKILMIAPTPFLADRGCHTQILLEIKALQKRGHEVILCTYGLGRDVPGVKTVRCWNFPWYKKLSAGPSYTKILLLPLLFFTTMRTIKKFNPDTVHAHLHEGALIARFCSVFYPKLLYLFDMQGSLIGECVQHGFVTKGSLFYSFLNFLEERIIRWFPIITQSESMLHDLITRGVEKNHISNVKDGVDTELFSPRDFNHELAEKIGVSKENPRVLFVGLLETYQGVDVMLQAFSRVTKNVSSVQFIIIGFPNIERYKSLCEELTLSKNVKFLGRVDYFKLPEYLSLSSIAVAPKIAETEADGKIYNYMAMGMNTIAFDRSVSREILAETGVYAKLNDPDDLADKILWAIHHPQESKNLGTASRLRAVQELSWEAVGSRIETAYSSFNEVTYRECRTHT